jgi:hypothetical protein
MNKQKLIRKYEELLKEHSPFHEPVPYTSMVELFLKELKQLDEPQKVTIPQFVADWIEVAETVYSLSGGMTYGGPGVNKWLENKDNQRTFVLAWFDGYEVEKEKRYKVVIKETKQPLYYNASDDKLFFSMGKIASHFTRQQLEKLNFGWVFDCEGIEVEEVTE